MGSEPFRPDAWRTVRLALGFVAGLILCGCGEEHLYPGRIEAKICDALTGEGIPRAKVIVNLWVGNWSDETPCSLPAIQTGSDGSFAIGNTGARRVQIEAVADGYHSMGWLYSGQDKLSLEPITSKDLLHIRQITVGYKDGRPFGYSFAKEGATFESQEWDIGPRPVGQTQSPHGVELEFRGSGGVVPIESASDRMKEHFFQYSFEPPTDGYVGSIAVRAGQGCGGGRCWFFRDSRGRFGKARYVSLGSGVDSRRDWDITFQCVYAESGTRWVEPQVEDLQPRWPKCDK